MIDRSLSPLNSEKAGGFWRDGTCLLLRVSFSFLLFSPFWFINNKRWECAEAFYSAVSKERGALKVTRILLTLGKKKQEDVDNMDGPHKYSQFSFYLFMKTHIYLKKIT